jgi:hypothetical protein
MVSLEFFSDIPSGRTMALGSTQPVIEMNQVYFLGGKYTRWVRVTNLPPSCAIVMKSGNLNFLEPSGPLQACNGTAKKCVHILCTCMNLCMYGWMDRWMVNLKFESYALFLMNTENILLDDQRLWWFLPTYETNAVCFAIKKGLRSPAYHTHFRCHHFPDVRGHGEN